MTKFTRFLIVAGILSAMGGGAFAAWHFRGHIADGPPPEPTTYDQFVKRIGAPEPAVRDELNFLMATASAPLSSSDRKKAEALTHECLDAKTLVAIDHVQTFMTGESSPYHFVSTAHRDKLRTIAGDSPSPERVLAIRKALIHLGNEFAEIRERPDWKVKIEEKGGPPPPLPFLDLLKSGSEFLPSSQHPLVYGEPRIAVFGGPDGELLTQLELFFNSDQCRAALPAAKYPKLYKNGRIPPVPTNLYDYQKQMEAGVGTEMKIILNAENPPADVVEGLNQVYAKLERFFTVVVQFDPK
ncbi:MAG TPA: hypothetical protein VHR66_08230 [Gemmataceae bacterium]|jgi:hypothetical protein|nr:hypothetical protein [Gemmataceae bacterium]